MRRRERTRGGWEREERRGRKRSEGEESEENNRDRWGGRLHNISTETACNIMSGKTVESSVEI